MSTIHTGEKSYDEVAGFFQNWPFQGQPAYPRVIHRHDVYFRSWGPSTDGLHRSPCHYYVSTPSLTTGIFTLAPGDWFEPGNHPDGEPYYMLEGGIWVGNADTGQMVEVNPGEGVLIPGMTFHFGYNFRSEMMKLLFMIPRGVMTDEFKLNPNYDDHFKNWRDPVVMNKESVHQDYEYDRWAQPNWKRAHRRGRATLDLRRWPPAPGQPRHVDPESDYLHVQNRGEWLHFVTGGDYAHQFLTSFIWSTDEHQFGMIKIPPGCNTSAITMAGERVYYPLSGEDELIVNIMETAESLIAHESEAIFIPAGVEHQFQNPTARSVEAIFACSTLPGVKLYD